MSAAGVGWWPELRSCALVGTARRPVPQPAELARFGSRGDEVASSVALLDALALATAARRAGQRPVVALEGPPPVDADDVEVASPVATQLLELLLGPTPPGGANRGDLLDHWFTTCAAAGRRVPDELIVDVLEHATGASALRSSAAAALGRRGRWLADQHERWWWVGAAADADAAASASMVDPDEWARSAAAVRVATLRAVRATDPAAGRALLASSWGTDPAGARAAHLQTLEVGLGPDDEAVLDAALDDRARGVRQVAMALLDGLTGSARAQRMDALLAPLLSLTGRRRARRLEVALPGDPDPAAVRDGLVPPPPGRSARGFWVEQLAAGAPLDRWTSVSGEDPAATLALIDDADARAGILRAVVARHDPAWAEALIPTSADPRLLDVLPLDRRREVILAKLRAGARPRALALAVVIDHLPAPWDAATSGAVVAAVRADTDPAIVLQQAGATLATRLDPTARAALETWLGELEEQPRLAAALRTLIQYQSVHRSITEAFP